MCLSLALVACGGGDDGGSPLQPAAAADPGGGGDPAPPPAPPPEPPPPTPPPPTAPPPSPAATDLEPAWRTTQGNAAHTGYVPLHVGRAEPVVAWEWPEAEDGAALPAINPVVTGNGSVYVATESYYCAATLYSLDGLNGSVRWTREFPAACGSNPPAFGGDRVYMVSTGAEGAELWALRGEDGAQVFHSRFDNQWHELPAPTVYEGAIYTNGGQGGVQAFDHAGVPLWHGAGSDIDLYAPAVDAAHVYHYSGTTLEIHERATGRHLGTILDTTGTGNFASYYGVPVIGGQGNVIVQSRSGTGDGRVLSSFDVKAKSLQWSTSREYDTAPAVANGVVYVARDDGMAVDAIDEATGQVLWSWSPAPGHADTGFRHNIIVTNDVLLVSTDTAVYAVDLATRQTAWSYGASGRLALSGRFLLVATGAEASDGRLLALDLGAERQASAITAAAVGRQPVARAGARPEGALQALIARAAALMRDPGSP